MAAPTFTFGNTGQQQLAAANYFGSLGASTQVSETPTNFPAPQRPKPKKTEEQLKRMLRKKARLQYADSQRTFQGSDRREQLTREAEQRMKAQHKSAAARARRMLKRSKNPGAATLRTLKQYQAQTAPASKR